MPGILHFAYDKMVASIEDSIVTVTVLDHLNVSRERQKIILHKEQKAAVKEHFCHRNNSANHYGHLDL